MQVAMDYCWIKARQFSYKYFGTSFTNYQFSQVTIKRNFTCPVTNLPILANTSKRYQLCRKFATKRKQFPAPASDTNSKFKVKSLWEDEHSEGLANNNQSSNNNKEFLNLKTSSENKQNVLMGNSPSFRTDQNKNSRTRIGINDNIDNVNYVDDSQTETDNFSSIGKHMRQEDILFNKLECEVKNASQMSIEDWETIRSSVLITPGIFNEGNIDAVMIKICSELSLPLCKSCFKYVKLKKERLNRAVYSNYLWAFYIHSHDCTDNDLNEIIHVYNELIHDFPLLDYNTAQKAVVALSITKHWKEYLKLFKVIKESYFPSSHTYSSVIKASFNNREFQLGWDLLEEMKINNLNIQEDVFKCWLNHKKTDADIERVLFFLQKYSIKPSLELCEIIKKCFKNNISSRSGRITSLSNSGICRNCSNGLEPAKVLKEEYENLKQAFLDPILIGKDIFLKTKPEELDSFMKLIEKTAPYDVVLDGLNIALKVHKSQRTLKSYSSQLKFVVDHFVAQGQKVLVCGRKHMEKWPEEDMRYIRNNAQLFLAEDTSQDDPFLLYAALYSGIGTRFVSRDLMRGHKFLLRKPELQEIFLRWQAQHQCFIKYIDNYGNVNLLNPVPFLQNVQKNSIGDWHIPYEIERDMTNKTMIDNYHKHWFCLTNQPVHHRSNDERGPPYQSRKGWDRPLRRDLPRWKT